jgi:hypothetical protein
MTGQSYEDRLDMIVTHAWEIWTNNGMKADSQAECDELTKTVQDAASNVYTDELDDAGWLAATLTRLGHVEQ